MVPENSLRVEVAYASSNATQHLLNLSVPRGSTVAYTIRQSGLLDHCPELNLAELQVGIFAKKVALDTKVSAGDRVEIYRPLKIDPKTARKLRQQQK